MGCSLGGDATATRPVSRPSLTANTANTSCGAPKEPFPTELICIRITARLGSLMWM